MRSSLIKGMLGAAGGRCEPLGEPVAWTGVLGSETPDSAEAPVTGEAIETQQATAPTEKGFGTGTTIDGGRGGVRRNESIGDASGGNGSSGGGVTAPSATGGVQLPDRGGDGGLQYGNGGSPTSAKPTATVAPL